MNGGQLHQLLHPNEAALSFTKPQLITLQVISKQDCLQPLISAAHPLFTHNQQDGDETRGRGGQKPCRFYPHNRLDAHDRDGSNQAKSEEEMVLTPSEQG